MNGITPRQEPKIYEIKIREYVIKNSLDFLIPSSRKSNVSPDQPLLPGGYP